MWNKIVRESQTKTLSPRNRANWDMATGVSVQTEAIRSSLPQPISSCLQTCKVLLWAEGWDREPPLGFPETAPVPRDALDSEWHCSRGCSLHREGLYTTSNPSCPDPSWLPDICEGTPWEGICKEPFILQWRGNLIITREFLQVPGSTEWTLPSVAGWNAANTNTMEALKKAERLSTHSPCLFSPEMKGGLQVSRNCAFWLVFIDSEVLADRQTDRQTGREGFHYSDVVSFPLRPWGFHCWQSLHIAVASPAGAGASGSCLSPRWCWKPACPWGTRLSGFQLRTAAHLSEM